jgi:hypothetical protein
VREAPLEQQRRQPTEGGPVSRGALRIRIGAVCLAAILAGLLAPPSPAATPGAAWSIRSLAVPTNFAPGDESGRYQYEVMAVNIGGAATDGSPIVLIDTLPADLTVKDVALVLRSSMDGTGTHDFGASLCVTEKPAASEIVRCTIPEELPETPSPTLVQPSEPLRLVIQVSTPAEAAGRSLANTAQVQGGGAGAVSTVSHNEANQEPAPAGFMDFRSPLLGADGLPVQQAGSHPYQYLNSFAVNTRPVAPGGIGEFRPAGGDVKDIEVELPPGLVGDPTATSRCTAQQFNTSHTVNTDFGATFTQNECPDGSAVGMVVVQQLEGHGETVPLPLYNLVPPKGMPAQFGFQILGAPFYIDTALRTGGDYGITATLRNATEVNRVTAADVMVWGVPADAAHNALRGDCLNPVPQLFPFSLDSCPAGLAIEPFLRLPTSCDAPLATRMSFDTWTDIGGFVHATSTEAAPVNCAPLDFSPAISAVPHTTVADSPSGLRFQLHLPQSRDPTLLAEADLRDAVVALPEGVTVNPSSANGLAACSPAQVGLEEPGPAHCPDASKIGAVEIDTPLLDHPVEGGVYVATQNDNPFHSLLAIYIAVDDPQSGVVVKLAGHVVADPLSGRLTTRFDDNPQLPFETLTVELFDGPRAPLRTPATCGRYEIATALTPWSAPESGPDASPSDAFAVGSAPGGGPCAANAAAQPHRPSFSAGALVPAAGAFSPFLLRMRREDGSQNVGRVEALMPPGLSGKLAGIPYCPETLLAAAATRAGLTERAAPSCPAASEVGEVRVGAGAGPSPVFVTGRIFLAGPYKGAPLSLAIVTPAVAGPFDLGTVVVRAAVRVDPDSARVSVASDPIPAILQGIPLDVRSIAVDVDRREFTLNPTSCEPKAVAADAVSLLGASAALSDRFQVAGCRGLPFQPRLSIRLSGGVRRTGHPGLRAVLKARPGDANVGRAVVSLPHSEFLDQGNIRTICTRVQFGASQCPPASVYGHAVAQTPLLDEPLQGPVYLRSSDNPLPDLVAVLRGPERQPIEVRLVGRIDSIRSGIRTTFAAVPDVPVSRFALTMQGGPKKGLLVNSTDVCGARYRAKATFTGQNGGRLTLRPPLRNSRCADRPRSRKRGG